MRTHAVLFALALALAATASGAPATQRLHLTGEADPAFGVDPPEFVFHVSPIAPDGSIYVQVAQEIDGSAGPAEIWRWRDGSFTPIADASTPVPGAPGMHLDGAFPLVMNGAGVITFESRLRRTDGAPGANPGGMFTIGEHGLSTVVLEGQHVPGTTDGTFDLPVPVGTSLAGRSVFYAHVDRPSGAPDVQPRTGFWRTGDDHPEFLIGDGAPAPGIPGATLLSLVPGDHSDSGAFVTFGRYTIGADEETRYGSWLFNDGAFTPLGHTGGPAPGVPGATIAYAGGGAINANADVVHTVELEGYEVEGASGVIRPEAMYLRSDGVDRLLAITGGVAPGTGGARFDILSAFGSNGPLINEAGDVLFFASLITDDTAVDESNDAGLWTERGDGPLLLLREGDAVPNDPDATFVRFRGAAMNNVGDIAFAANLTEGVGLNEGLWAYIGAEDRLMTIARVGMPFDVSPLQDGSDVRTIEYVQDGDRAFHLNDAGQLLYTLRFTDGTWGTFVTTIPSPGPAALLGFAALWLSPTRRPRARSGRHAG